MNSKTIILIAINLLLFTVGIGYLFHKRSIEQSPPPIVITDKPLQGSQSPLEEQKVLPQINYQLTNPKPGYMNYRQTVERLKQWESEAPELVEVGTYGKSTRGQDLYYIRVMNKRYSLASDKPRVLITACIHGNEPLSSSTVMWYIGHLLDRYGDDPRITELVDSRDIYFVPVVSPDSYPSSRYVDGVDPNRNFPGPANPNRKSVAPVAAVQDLFNKVRPKAVISGHTWGQVYLIPHGDKMTNCPNHADYERIIGKMAQMSQYRWIRACDMYKGDGSLNNPPIRSIGYNVGMYTHSRPIYGSDVDWYYRAGSFAIVMEFGTHQRIPSEADTRAEFTRTLDAVLHFIKEAPLVVVKPN